MPKSTPQLGAPDPERRTSPVAWDSDEDTEALRESVPGDATCYFNDSAYDHGTTIESGGVLLKCERGIWVPAGPAATAKP